MSDLVAVSYPDEQRAAEVFETLNRLQTERLLEMEDMLYVTRGQDGKVRLHQAVNTAGAGAAGGALWGTIAGLLFLTPLVGMAIGAATGAILGKFTDYGIDDKFVKQLGSELQPGSSALFVLIRRATPDKVVAEVSKYGGTVIRSSLSNEAEARLQAALSAAQVPAPA